MKAVVFHAIGDIRVEDVPEPVIEQPTDAIVRLTASAICGTDLHFVRGTFQRHEEGPDRRSRGRRHRRERRPRGARDQGWPTGHHPVHRRLRPLPVLRQEILRAVCAAGRILNAKTAHSQVIGGMVMGLGAALIEEMAVDGRFGFFVNHDLAAYEVPVHMDVPHLDAFFIDEVDPTISPVKAKGVGELGLTGVAPAIANAVYNATGVRVRDYPLTLEKHLDRLPTIT